MIRRLAAIVAVIVTAPAALSIVATGNHQVANAAVVDTIPYRALDTRIGLGAPIGKLRPGTVLTLQLPDVRIDGSTAVLLNVTNADADGPGYVSAWSCADPQPATSILNVVPGRSTPNMVALAYTPAGLCLAANVAVDLVVDVTGVATGGDFVPAAPRRLVDSRQTQRLVGGREYRYKVAGTGGIASNAVAAAMNLTVVDPSVDGYLIAKPCGSASNASTMNYLAHEIVPHFTFSKLSGGDVCIMATATTDLVIDTFGSLRSAGAIQMLVPDRVLDTRDGTGGTTGGVVDGQLVKVRIAGYAGVPNTAAGVTVNLIAVDGAAAGFVAMWPCDHAQPATSTINLWRGVLRANQATIRLSAAGELCLRARIADSSRLHLVLDVVGYTAGNVDRGQPPATTTTTTTTTTAPPPSSGHFSTLAVGAALPSGAECGSRVRAAAETRPANAAANANRGSRANANTRSDWVGFSRVDGAFSGTTDEIIQWAACKWGIDEDVVRAQVVKESYWYQSANGDNGESWGLGQVRDTAHPSAFQYSNVNARNSSAYNLDYTYASWRACYEGIYTWLNTVEHVGTYGAGDMWGCIGVWFSGRWYVNNDAYLNQVGDSVTWHYTNRTWATSTFLNG